VTYLRQDFSRLQPVEDAGPWPEMQRFDFLVRTREVSEDEAAAYREKLDKRAPGRLSPYHRAAQGALRELTGKDAFEEVRVMDPWVYAAIVCMGCTAGVGVLYCIWRFTRKPQPQP
jgi:hypothetical protein